MGTPFETIYDRALIIIEDYKLDKLAKYHYDVFLLYLENILIKAIPDFTSPLVELSYDIEKKVFNNTLSSKEINILASIMVMNWFSRKINDVTQFQGHLNNKEFKAHSEASNLKEKSEYLDRLNEKHKQDIVDYEIQNLESIPYFKNIGRF